MENFSKHMKIVIQVVRIALYNDLGLITLRLLISTYLHLNVIRCLDQRNNRNKIFITRIRGCLLEKDCRVNLVTNVCAELYFKYI